MLNKLTIKNFKRFESVEIELGGTVVFVGPNNSGKTTALQALALWEAGIRRWKEKRSGKPAPSKRPGVTLNRRDLIAVPAPDANLLWRGLRIREVERVHGKQITRNIRIEISVDGVTGVRPWSCGLEFDYANAESLYCRPLRAHSADAAGGAVPDEASDVRLAFLPPMSGLTSNETQLTEGAINLRLSEGRTAEVLRNLCFQVAHSGDTAKWHGVVEQIRVLFGVKLDDPQQVPERGEIAMSYRDESGARLDLSCAGRGMQQTLLLLAHMARNPGAVLLLDEPDAHLEILRQRQIYGILSASARESGSQIVAASHSETFLNEAAQRDAVVAFLGRPHRIDSRASQLLKSLRDIGFEDYYQAEQSGWVLYLEGSTDLAILGEFARILNHPAAALLESPFVKYVTNQPMDAVTHFQGLREAKRDLAGFALFDRVEKPLPSSDPLRLYAWRRREIENYVCQRENLLAWAREDSGTAGPLFAGPAAEAMEQSIREVEAALDTLGKGSPWSPDIKVTDEFLDPLFDKYYAKLRLPNAMRKTNYHRLAHHSLPAGIDPEVGGVLDRIVEVARAARPVV